MYSTACGKIPEVKMSKMNQTHFRCNSLQILFKYNNKLIVSVNWIKMCFPHHSPRINRINWMYFSSIILHYSHIIYNISWKHTQCKFKVTNHLTCKQSPSYQTPWATDSKHFIYKTINLKPHCWKRTGVCDYWCSVNNTERVLCELNKNNSRR